MKKKFTLLMMFLFSVQLLAAATIKGVVKDAATGKGLEGTVVFVKEDQSRITVSSADGVFEMQGVTKFPLVLVFDYVGYESVEVPVQKMGSEPIEVRMKPTSILLEDVLVLGRRRTDNETSVIADIKNSTAVVTGVSSEQIKKTSDSDAGEVIKRVPGISLIDDRFVIVRGLGQRYNNVWINGGAVPSSESDGRAFSFDMLPSSSIANMIIVKSPTADLPGDFSGGFIRITTKEMPEESSINFGVVTGFNTVTHFNKTRLSGGSSTDFLGFDRSKRPLSKDFPTHLGQVTDPGRITELTKNGFNNDWQVKTMNPLPDIKFHVNWNERVSDRTGMILTLGYSNVFKTLKDIRNSRYGVYNPQTDSPVIEKDYIDNQYTNEVKINAMNNWSFRLNNQNNISFRNLFSLIGKNRLTERYGVSVVSGEYYENQTEMLYTSRLSYTGQLAGSHHFSQDLSQSIEWNLGYSYASRNDPDRRIVSNIGSIPANGEITPDIPTYNDHINRYFEQLTDHIGSLSVDYKKSFNGGNWKPELRAGVYGEYRTRSYLPREFTYRYDRLSPTQRQEYIYLPYTEMMASQWLGYDKVYVDEVTKKTNAYTGNNSVAAAYATADLPFGKFKANVGLRAEQWNMSVTYDRAISPSQTLMTTIKRNELSLLPSVSLSYDISEKHLLRAAYGRSVNRPEFREISPAVYYDFDLFAEVQGNPDLQMATIDNVDLRYEFYPSRGETVSLGAFYKHFINPIEWNFVDMGGSYRYSYQNARSAYTAGIELDVRKNLDFIGVPALTLLFNGTLVASQVQFKNDGLVKNPNRPLQGQSPYVVNAGLFYTSSEKLGLSASILYNIIGKRIIGVGKSTSIDGNTDYNIPDAYEMPRHTLDLTIGKKIGKLIEIKLGIKNLLAQEVVIKQFPTTTIESQQVTREQITRKYNPGTSFSLGIVFNF